MEITKRDMTLLSELSDYGLFSTSYIVEKYFNNGDYSSALRRLRILEKGNYIRRAGFLKTKENLWAITPFGGKKMPSEYFKSYWNQSTIEHDYRLIKLRIDLEALGVVKRWIPEHVIRSMVFQKYSLRDAKKKLIPDGMFDCQVLNSKMRMAFELELTLKSRDRYKNLFGQYQWKENLHGVWYVITSEYHLKKLTEYWSSFKEYSSKVKIYFSYLDDLIKLKGSAKMYGLQSTYLINDFFSLSKINVIETAHQVDQKVGALNHQDLKSEALASNLNHTPNLGFIS